MMPKAGGQYVYLRRGAWTALGLSLRLDLFLVIQTGTIAAVAVAFGKFLGVFFPSVSTTHWLWHIAHVPPIAVGRWFWQHGHRPEHRQPYGHPHRLPTRHREHLRRQAGRAHPEHLYFGQKHFRWPVWFCSRSPVGRNATAWPRTSAMRSRNFGAMPGGQRFIPSRWESAARLFLSTWRSLSRPCRWLAFFLRCVE